MWSLMRWFFSTEPILSPAQILASVLWDIKIAVSQFNRSKAQQEVLCLEPGPGGSSCLFVPLTLRSRVLQCLSLPSHCLAHLYTVVYSLWLSVYIALLFVFPLSERWSSILRAHDQLAYDIVNTPETPSPSPFVLFAVSTSYRPWTV